MFAVLITAPVLLAAPSAPPSSPPAPSAGSGSYAAVAPILQRNCAQCHRPQGGAPFSLLTYADAKQWGEQILEVTQNRYMPPWLPAPGRGDFQGQRRLSDAELAAIRRWVSAGLPEGTPAKPVAAPASTAQSWKLGKPDLTIELAQPVALPGSGADQFLNLIVPYPAAQPHAIRALEIRASDSSAVRSLWIELDNAGTLRKAHAADWQAGIPGMEPALAGNGQQRTGGQLMLWRPEAPVLKAAGGSLFTLTPGADLVLTTHFKTTGRAEKVQLTVALYYAPGSGGSFRPPEVVELQHDAAIQIPAGAAAAKQSGEFTLPQAVRLAAIYPRMHFLGKSIDAFATLPNGRKEWLVSIPRWDLDWQDVYHYKQPVVLPKGAVIHWEATYDNSGDNPRNPSDPPREVRSGPAPDDEAGEVWLELLPAAGAAPSVAWRQKLQEAAQSAGAGPPQPSAPSS